MLTIKDALLTGFDTGLKILFIVFPQQAIRNVSGLHLAKYAPNY